VSRRRLLQIGAAGLAALAGGGSAARSAPATGSKSGRAAEVLAKLKGPLASISIPYDEDFAVDHDSLRRWVSLMCEQRAPVLFLTLGDGELDFLSEEEIEAVIRTVTQEAAGRALVVGGTGGWTTEQLVPFVLRVQECGVDAINVHLNSRIAGGDQIRRVFDAIAAQTDLPLLAYEENKNFDLALIRDLAKRPTVVGMKCHEPLYGFYDYTRATRGDGFAVLGAGLMRQFLFGQQVGSPGYLCLIASFAPSVSLQFVAALEQGDYRAAQQIVFEHEEPLMEVVRPLSFPQTYKSIHYIAGLYRTNLMRSPRQGNTEEQLQPLRALLKARYSIGT
jgi:4-hydroxy-tetrahydrodipicolinate synthase